MSEQQAREELTEAFGDAVAQHPDVMAECLSILRLYNLAPASLHYKFEALLLSRPAGLRAKLSTFTLDSARELRKEIQREQQAKAVANMSTASPAAGNENAKGAVGVRKSKGAVTDLGGFLEGLSTPVRSTSNGTSSRLSNTSNNANRQAAGPYNATPTHSANAFSTPQRISPMAPSFSSYRPSSSQLAPPNGSHRPGSPIDSGLSAPSSPVSGLDSPGASTPTKPQPFKLRPQPHSLVETLNPNLPGASELGGRLGVPPGSKSRVSLAALADPKDWDYRYMFEKVSQRSEALDEQIDDFADAIKEAYGLTELGDPHFASEDPIYTVGRILSPPTDSTKVNTSSLFLESSRFLGSGRRVALRFLPFPELKVRGGAPGVKSFGLFPGCLICVKGKNGGGGAFVVEEVLMPPPSALQQTHAEELLAFQHGEKLGGEPILLMSAAGPFTLEDDLDYAPLNALIDVVVDERPDVLVLLGPFVDSQHPLIMSGAIERTPTEIFREQVSARLQRIVDASPGTMIIILPSVRDIVSRHVAFPQAALERELLGIPKRVRLLPNPASFSINEITFSVTTVDILFHLRKEEVLQRAEEAEPDPDLVGTESKDAMASLVRHVLGQRSFYPIFPPGESYAAEVNLDATHQRLMRLDESAPDVLITPSKLKHFSKVVDSTLVLNPAHLSRAHTAGTFAKLLLHPQPKRDLEAALSASDEMGGMREHALWERARAEIWRI